MDQFKLSYPVKPIHVNQPFGVNPQTYAQFGINGHNGIDFMATHGQPVYASHDGFAIYETDDSQGHGVVIVSDKDYPYQGDKVFFKTIYWHFCDPAKEPQHRSPVEAYMQANKNQRMPVKRGDLIGYADSTGFSTGDHLHFGLKPVMLGEDAYTVFNFAQKNGYAGAIDPQPFLFLDPVPVPVDLSPADKVAVIAAQTEAAGNTKDAGILWSLVAFLKAFFSK